MNYKGRNLYILKNQYGGKSNRTQLVIYIHKTIKIGVNGYMENPIKTIKEKVMKVSFSTILILILATALFLGTVFKWPAFLFEKKPDVVYQLSSADVELFYSVETKRILFLDRKTDQVKQILASDLTENVFLMKAIGVKYEFENADKSNGSTPKKKDIKSTQ